MVMGTRQWRSLPWRGRRVLGDVQHDEEVARVAAVGAGLAFAGETQAHAVRPRPAGYLL